MKTKEEIETRINQLLETSNRPQLRYCWPEQFRIKLELDFLLDKLKTI